MLILPALKWAQNGQKLSGAGIFIRYRFFDFKVYQFYQSDFQSHLGLV